MKVWKFIAIVLLLALTFAVVTGCGEEGSEPSPESPEDLEPIKIGLVTSQTGVLEAYGKQHIRGFELGIEYATGGTNMVAGREIEIHIEDTETNPDVAKQKALKLLDEEGVDFLVGCASSSDALAVLPLAEEYETIMVVEPAVADSITGGAWNRYIFRTGRNSSQDAIAGAAAIAGPDVRIAVLAPDYAFGHDGAAAFVSKAEEMGAEIILQEFPAPDATDFTPHIQRIIDAAPDYLFVIWSGTTTPWPQIADMDLPGKGIKISTGAPDMAALTTMWNVVGMEGFCVYYHKLPDNEVNDWLVEKHQELYNEPPDLFTAGGMAAAMSIVQALEETEGDTDTETLLTVMEGMTFDSPKGPMTFRQEDHQALQSLYAIRLDDTGLDWPEPVLMREMKPEETVPPIMN